MKQVQYADEYGLSSAFRFFTLPFSPRRKREIVIHQENPVGVLAFSSKAIVFET